MKRKNFYYLAVIVLVGLLAFFIWQKNRPFVSVENPDKELKGQAYLDYWEKLNEEYKKDNYGGATPEETLNMFIAALKAGDLELASKYFVVEKQPFILRDFENSKDGYIESLISDLEKEKVGSYWSDKNYVFTTFDSNKVAEFTFELFLNPHTNKWKMYEL